MVRLHTSYLSPPPQEHPLPPLLPKNTLSLPSSPRTPLSLTHLLPPLPQEHPPPFSQEHLPPSLPENTPHPPSQDPPLPPRTTSLPLPPLLTRTSTTPRKQTHTPGTNTPLPLREQTPPTGNKHPLPGTNTHSREQTHTPETNTHSRNKHTLQKQTHPPETQKVGIRRVLVKASPAFGRRRLLKKKTLTFCFCPASFLTFGKVNCRSLWGGGGGSRWCQNRSFLRGGVGIRI